MLLLLLLLLLLLAGKFQHMGLKPGSRVLAVPVRSPESSDFFSSDSAKEIDEIDDNVPPIGDGQESQMQQCKRWLVTA
jgi:hypothetical protein